MSKAGIPEPTIIKIKDIPKPSAKKEGSSDYTKLIQDFRESENRALQWEFPFGESVPLKDRSGKVKEDEFIFEGKQQRDKIASGLYSSRTKLGLDKNILKIVTRDKPRGEELFGVYLSKTSK